jgi:acyl-coenzyme A thioesterase PaaI-like protein
VHDAIQDQYSDDLSYCYGCGRLNESGYQLKSYWDGSTAVAHFRPEPYQTSLPGFVYGGLIASLIDCHGTGTAAAAASRVQGRPGGSLSASRFVTASLKVDYLRPTPMGVELELRGTAEEVGKRKVVVSVTLLAGGEVCARGTVVAVQAPETMIAAVP